MMKDDTLSRRERQRSLGRFSLFSAIALILLPVIVGLICLCIGRISVSPYDAVAAVGSVFVPNIEVPRITYQTVINLRLPRILLAALCGAGLSVSGSAFQSLFSNPLATPDTLGVASGASFGAALGILFGFNLIGIQLCSMVFGFTAILLTWLAGSGKGRGLNSIVLAGIMMGSLFSALVSLVKYVADTESQLPAISYFLMGSISTASYSSLTIGAMPILLAMLVLYLARWKLNVLPLSNDEAHSSGVNVRMLRVITVLCATTITASCVSMCGPIGWVGLLIPHACRLMFGSNHALTVPAAISIGATFTVIVDTVARSATQAEIPISILTALIGAPFFIVLMRQVGRQQI